MFVYYGFNAKYRDYYIEATPTGNEGYFESFATKDFKFGLTTTVLWKINKKIYLETRWLPNVFIDIRKDERIDKNPGYNRNRNDILTVINADEPFQIGLKYILKTEKPAKTKNKPAIKTKK